MADVMPAQRWLEAENAVIGALLLDERLASPILAAVDAADICDAANRRIYQAARALLLSLYRRVRMFRCGVLPGAAAGGQAGGSGDDPQQDRPGM